MSFSHLSSKMTGVSEQGKSKRELATLADLPGKSYLLAAVADEFVDGKDGRWHDEEPLEERRLHKTTAAVKDEQDVHHYVQVMRDPERAEEIAACVWHGEDVESDAHQHQQVTSHT